MHGVTQGAAHLWLGGLQWKAANSLNATGRRPGLPGRRERRRQYVRQPWRCHRSTVSGFTTRREVRQPLNHRHAKIQNRLIRILRARTRRTALQHQ